MNSETRLAIAREDLTPPTLRQETLQSFEDMRDALSEHVRWEYEKYNRLHEHLQEVVELQRLHSTQLSTVSEWMTSIHVIVKFFTFIAKIAGFLIMLFSGLYSLHKVFFHKE